MTDFLLELRSEEIPARMQVKAKADLERLFVEAMAKAGLAAARIETFATPRRLALIAHDLPLAAEAVAEETKGPKVGASPQALEGFLRKTGLTQDQLVERDGVYFAVVDKPGRATADVLAEAIPAIIRAFPWPKSMRWGVVSSVSESLRWVRPLSGIIALLGDSIVPCAIEGVTSGRETMGHRFHSHGPVSIANAGAYVEALRAAHVIVHFSERCALIRDGAAKAAADAGLVLVEDEALVVENAGLTEWPVPLLGRFDAAFLEVPPEVIQLTARVNQKYFVCEDAQGKLANAFICTANIVPSDGGAGVIDGNRKVLAARLSDARFFWEQDQKKTLAQHGEKLANIVFHEKLGTVADKVERVAKLARWLVEEGIISSAPRSGGEGDHAQHGGGVMTPPATPLHHPSDGPPPHRSDGEERAHLADLAEQAARLCKADLVTEMVGEFPELQGIMGGYYAAKEGLDPQVAAAIRDHYKPVGQGDNVPTAPVTVAVSLADKLDTIIGFYYWGEMPTGSKDPFALRRAAIGILRTILKNAIRLRLQPAFYCGFQLVHEAMRKLPQRDPDLGFMGNAASGAVLLVIDRLKVQQREAGVRHDLIDAVFALGGEDDLVRLLARVKALQAFMDTPDGANLLAGYKRAANLLKSSPERGGGPPTQSVVEGSLSSEPALTSAPGPSVSPDGLPPSRSGEDLALLTALDTAEPAAATAVTEERFTDAMAALACLRAPIDAFFEGVMVNDPDPAVRSFRLGLLARFTGAVHAVADFSKIEG
jgi:glycyl-tRNA synthetase beta chain